MNLLGEDGVIEAIERGLTALASVLLAWVALSTTAAVISRRLLGEPLPWAFEIAEYSLVGITFAALALVGRENGHVRMELLGEILPQRFLRPLNVVAEAISFVVLAVALAAAVLITAENVVDGTRLSGLLRIPRWVVLSLIPIGVGLLAIEHARRIVLEWRGGAPTDATRTDLGDRDPGPGTGT